MCVIPRIAQTPLQRLGTAAIQARDLADRAFAAAPGPTNEFPDLTVLKTAAVSWYMGMYAPILRKAVDRRLIPARGAVFVDLLAGSGITAVKGRNLRLAGASLIALQQPFDGVTACEIDGDRAALLQRRAKSVGSPVTFDVQAKAAQEAIPELKQYLEQERAHFLAYIDLQGAELAWADLAPLFQLRCDVIYNFQAAELNRNIGKPGYWEKVTGVPEIQRLPQEADRLHLFKRQFQDAGFDLVEDIRIGIEGSSFHYYLIFAAHRTKGGNPWWQLVIDSKRLIEEDVQGSVKSLLSILEGKQKTLPGL